MKNRRHARTLSYHCFTRKLPGLFNPMKLNFEVAIHASMDDVWAAFDNPGNMSRWQQNLKSFTHKTGTPGEIDATSELIYDEKGREVVMTETITERRAPDLLAGIYETQWGKTLIVNHFRKLDDDTTQWESWVNFSFKGYMNVMAFFVAGKIREHTEADMHRFKLMVESDLASQR